MPSEVSPYLYYEDAGAAMDWLIEAFGFEEDMRMKNDKGRVEHGQLKAGDGIVMMGEPMGPQQPPMPSMLYLYVKDVDAAYQRAVKAGGTSVQGPANQFYGDRNAMVKDSSGNIWGIATHVEDIAPEEMAKRAQAAMKQRQGS